MITDELREWTRRYAYFKADLMAIADRIDAEHRAALEKVAAMVDELEEDVAVLEQQSIRYALFKITELDARVERIERKMEAR